MADLKRIFSVLLLIWIVAGTPAVYAAIFEVLSDVSVEERGGVDAVRIDFAIPVHYISHFPSKHGKKLTINIRFDSRDVPDTSQLPLLQTLNAPPNGDTPLIDVTYQTENNRPQLVVSFKKAVNFKVSQAMGISNLVIFLPELKHDIETDPIVLAAQPLQPPAAVKGDTEDEAKAKKLLEQGRRALRKADYSKAIGIFTAVLSMPENKYTPAALELLGVSRERNNQIAHAKVVYEQFLEKYPEGDASVRVRQRIAELIASEMKPKRKLKASKRDDEKEKAYSSKFIGSWSQYVDFNRTVTERSGLEIDKTTIDNRLSLNWRIHTGDWDIRNRVYANFEYDTSEGESEDGVEVSNLYSKIKNRDMGLYATLGRQIGSAAGVLGRFDGVYLGYDAFPNIRFNGVWGYPVDIFDKGTVQSNRPMTGFSVDVNEIVKGLDTSVFFVQQQVDSIVDRSAVGTEVRYFHQKANFFSILDYDVEFSDINIFMLQGQYLLQKTASVTFNFDYRRSPLLEISNALIGLDEDVMIQDLLDGTKTSKSYSADQLKRIAEDRSGYTKLLTLGVNYELSAKHQLVVDISRSEYLAKVIAIDNNTTPNPTNEDYVEAEVISDKSLQVDTSLQLVSKDIFQPKDIMINTLRHTHASGYNETTYVLTHRVPFVNQYRFEPRLVLKYRQNDSGTNLMRTIPGARAHFLSSQDVHIYMEANIDFYNYSGNEGNNEDLRSTNFYFGYSWNF